MKTMLVDDEWWSINQLKMECESISEIEIVATFEDASDALDFARGNKVEMAFLDIEMPGMNGIELGHKLRELDPSIAIVFVSAYDRYMKQAAGAEYDAFVMKPYTSDDLVDAISGISH